MGLGRALLCIILPPLAVLDRGCGTILIVTLLTCCAWVPGALAALFLNMQQKQQPQQITIINQAPPTDVTKK